MSRKEKKTAKRYIHLRAIGGKGKENGPEMEVRQVGSINVHLSTCHHGKAKEGKVLMDQLNYKRGKLPMKGEGKRGEVKSGKAGYNPKASVL